MLIISACSDAPKSIHPVKGESKEKSELITELCKKFDAQQLADSVEFFTPDYQSKILEGTVIIDSTLKEIKHDESGHYIQAEVASNESLRIYASIKFDDSQYEDYLNSKSNNALLVVKLSNINLSDDLFELKVLEGDTLFLRAKNSLLLTGECLAYYEYSTLLRNDF
ncbi:MAG: hypothetical protein K8F36_04975 [Melioribacteraceae bacterium]|nr:hypothetical protein [Melioribacteraceae bacterium]MCO6473078.1 hypothetical protein [Melioribacteraceae bacterium]MDD3558015.1 hypothetical protein [Melioribacteraceae bacterium]